MLADNCSPSIRWVGFRNLAVHTYARIDAGKVYAILMDNLPDFEAFAAAILHFLAADEEGGGG